MNYDEKITLLVSCRKCNQTISCTRGSCAVCMARNICVFRLSKTIKRTVGGVCWQCESIDSLRRTSQKPKKEITTNFPYNKHKRKKKRRRRCKRK